VIVSSGLSVLISTAGLALLRGTRPSEVERFQKLSDIGPTVQQWLLWNVLGVFGALLLYIGLVLGNIPMLIGVSTDDEGKASAILHSCLVLVCWLAERYLVTGHPLPLMQSALCAMIWFGSTVVEWAGPRPYDNMSLGLAGQISGCDGGYRSPFMIYAAVWLTGLTFGTLLLFCEEGTSLVNCVDPSDDEDSHMLQDAELPQVPHPLRRKALPLVYGLATSMSGVVFATGTASNDMRFVIAGALLTVIAVACAWDWLWRLEMNLATFGALFQGFATVSRVVQGHAVFRDFRWDPSDVHGMLVVYKFPGLQIFMFGMFIMFISLQLYLYTSTWKQWSSNGEVGYSHTVSRVDSRDEDDSIFGPKKLCRGSSLWQWLLLPVCMICIIIGTHIPLIQLPDVTWLHDAAAIQRFEASHEPGIGHRFTDGDSYIDVITWLYDRRLPCSALVVSYNAMILPPLQFLLFFLILLRPGFIPEELIFSMQSYVMNLAPMRFTQPCIMMLIVGIANMPGPGDTLFGGWFTNGYWYFMTYCVTAIILAWSVQPTEEDKNRYGDQEPDRFPCESIMRDGTNGGPDGNSGESLKSMSAEKLRLMGKYAKSSSQLYGDEDLDLQSDASDDGGLASFQAIGALLAAAFLVTAVFLALTQPFLYFEYRLSGVVVHGMTPTVLDLWFSIGSVSRFLMCFSAATCIVLPATWIVLFGLRMMPNSAQSEAGRLAKRLEPTVRPWVMCHIWAASFVLVYYMVLARNKAIVEVCAQMPKLPIGFVAIGCMGVGTYGLIHFAKDVTKPSHLPKQGPAPPLPGGAFVWSLGPAATMAFWGLLLWSHGPSRPPDLTSIEDLNSALSAVLPAGNAKLRKQIPESAGDCEAFWNYRTRKGEVLFSSPLSEIHRTCSGNSPLAHMTRQTGNAATDITALWADGLNTLELVDVVVKAPPNASAHVQQWYATVSGMFTDLHVFLKVLVDDQEWLSDYMCCDKILHFTLQVSAECVHGIGFGDMQLEMLHLDKIDFVQKTNLVVSPGASESFEMDYGTSEVVEKAIANFMTLKTGKLLMRNSDGSTTDTLQTLSHALSHITELNMGHHCPSHM